MSENKIQELQILEQSLQNLLMQKQAFQMELSETQSAIEEMKNSGDEVFKIVGQIMIKSDKNKILQELEHKVKLLDLRMKSFEKQEATLSEKAQKLQKEALEKDKEQSQ